MSEIPEWIKIKPAPHKLVSKIGYCPECDEVHIDEDLSKLMKPEVNLSKRLRQTLPEYNYVCSQCGVPLAKTKEEVSGMEKCWFCGSGSATTKTKFEGR